MDTNTRALLSQTRLGLAAIADAYDRLLDIETVAYACQLADRMQSGIQAILDARPTVAGETTLLAESIAELRSLLTEREAAQVPHPRTEQIRQLAKDRWLEARFDQDAEVIEDVEGAHVQGWLWVSFKGTKLTPPR